MKVRLERSGKVLKVLFRHVELALKHLDGGRFRRHYGSSRGVTFTFEKRAKGFFLYVSFDRYKDTKVLSRICDGRPVAELQMLSKLAHLPCAKIYVSEVPLPDGRNVDLIDTVKFELRKVADGVWESGGIESEVDGLRRQMTLNSLKDGLPRFYLECGPDKVVASQAESTDSEVIFARRVKELKPETEFRENCRKGEDSTSELKLDPRRKKEATLGHVLAPKEKRADLPQEGESKVAPLIVPEKRGSDWLEECDECHEMFDKGSLFERRTGFYVCWSCYDVCGIEADEGPAADETIDPEKMTRQLDPKRGEPQAAAPNVPAKRDPSEIAECDGCEELFYERELIEIKPGLYVCKSCGDDDDTLRSLGLTPDEMDSFWRLMRCDWCGQPLTEVEPGSWLCPGCSFLKEVIPTPSVRYVEGMLLLETRIDIPIGPGKVIPAGKWIIGTSVADGWKIGAEYSFAVESIWRRREKAGFDEGPLVKVDVKPSIIVPNGAVTPGVRVSWR